MKKIIWGVISTAQIGLNKVIPAMQKGEYSSIYAIASRNLVNAKSAAERLGIPVAYGSYEELLSDSKIEAVYIPLPNHLHIEWIKKSLDAGKHVLCEKPIALNSKQAGEILSYAEKYPMLKVQEAFMYRHHLQWQAVNKLIHDGAIGELRNMHSEFFYYNVNPRDIRNIPEFGGGALLDIGCYSISVSRLIFGSEPTSVSGSVELDPKMKTDRLTSGILKFKNGTATFTCSTQMHDRKFVEINGTNGRIEVENPFTPGSDQSCKITLCQGSIRKEIIVEPCAHYTIQGDLFSLSILNNTIAPVPLSDALANMKVIDGIFNSSFVNIQNLL